jgi:hypothetical protein
MSRIIGKPIDPQNGYPWVGTVTLLKDSRVTTMKNGKKQWKGFGAFEKSAKGDRSGKNAVGLTTGFDSDLADRLIDWPKGTRLFVQGAMVKSDYWTQKNGTDSYELVVEYVHDQHDYHAAQNDALDKEAFDGVSEDEYGNSYDPGF